MAFRINVTDKFDKVIETTLAYDEEELESLLEEIEEDYPDCEVSYEEVMLWYFVWFKEWYGSRACHFFIAWTR